ncbi:MAG: urea ABC transporter permease subunit UrtB [Brevirhabdus sp.]
MIRVLLTVLALLWLPIGAQAQTLQELLQQHQKVVAKPSRNSVGPVLDALVGSGLPEAPEFLTRWQSKDVWQRKSDGLFFYGAKADAGIALTDPSSGQLVDTITDKKAVKQIKPNGGVRKAIGAALVQFQLSDPDIEKRAAALDAISRNPDGAQLGPLLASVDTEPDPALKQRKSRLATYLTARFGDNADTRIAAIAALSSDLSVEGRAVLNLILDSRLEVANTLPDDANIAAVLKPGEGELTRDAAYAMLVDKMGAPMPLSGKDIRLQLEAHIEDGKVGGVPLAALNTVEARIRAYDVLAANGAVAPRLTETERVTRLDAVVFYKAYAEPNTAITDAAKIALSKVELRVDVSQAADLSLDAISLASIYFLAAIGLAITFGVMGVINMAHGEFIMMGAYTGYVVQQFVPNYTLSLVVALPLAFAVTFAAGVTMERLVIRWLYNRPLETLLATFGISIALQQLAKNIFGTQARPLTSPDWLDGAWMINDVIQISYIRIAIFVLAVLFLGLLLFILKKTRLGLEVRAVTQNPRMASSMGINPDRIKMLTFGLGSGIAGIAGVAIGLYAKVTSEMGSDYIVQSFMTVVVGGVGNVWGTLAGAGLIGVLQKGIEWLNPSNTLAAQTYMILFIILFIQFRPKGIVALKGRAAGD